MQPEEDEIDLFGLPPEDEEEPPKEAAPEVAAAPEPKPEPEAEPSPPEEPEPEPEPEPDLEELRRQTAEPEDPARVTFGKLLGTEKRLNKLTPEQMQALQTGLEKDVVAAYKAKNPGERVALPKDEARRRAKLERLGKKLDEGVFEDLLRTWREEYVLQADAMRAQRDMVSEQLGQLAETLEPRPGTEWHMYIEVNSSSFHTQTASHTYARAAVEQYVPMVEEHGIEAQIRVNRWEDGKDIADYQLWVRCEPLDWEIMTRRPFSMKGWLEWCWSKAINPRVLQPGLPPGLEQKLGVEVNGRPVTT